MSEFSHKLRDSRKAKGYTQETMANAIGVQTRRYAHWEQGSYEPPLDVLARICKALDLDANYLLGIGPKPEHEQLPINVLNQIKKLVS